MLNIRQILTITASVAKHTVELDDVVSGFSIDTRTLKPGNIFVALQGEAHHGNAFAEQAIAHGAMAILTDQELDFNFPCIIVQSSLSALSKIAEYQRARFKGKVCGVTGSVGKTSVKEALGYLIRQLGLNVHMSEKSYNNHIGVPLTLANLDQNADIAIIEMGTNHPGEILSLTQLVRPNVAVVTAIGPGHIEFFNTTRDIALEKISIAAKLTECGVAILPKDSEFFDLIYQIVTQQYNHMALSFGNSEHANVRALSVEMVNMDKLRVCAKIVDTEVVYDLPTTNYGWVSNSLAILAGMHVMDLDIEKAAQYFNNLPLVAGRGCVHSLIVNNKQITLIDDAYNANPLSMQAALEMLSRYPGRTIAVLGDMRELGESSEQYHADIGQLIVQLGINKVLTCGTFMKHAFDQLLSSQQLLHVDQYTEVLGSLLGVLLDGDVVLLKASNGVKLHQVVAQLIERST